MATTSAATAWVVEVNEAGIIAAGVLATPLKRWVS